MLYIEEHHGTLVIDQLSLLYIYIDLRSETERVFLEPSVTLSIGWQDRSKPVGSGSVACAIRSGDIGGEAIDDINQESEPSPTDVCKVSPPPTKKNKNKILHIQHSIVSTRPSSSLFFFLERLVTRRRITSDY